MADINAGVLELARQRRAGNSVLLFFGSAVNQRSKGNSAMSAWRCHEQGPKARAVMGLKQV